MVIPKTVNPVRIVENYKSTSLSLTEDDIKRLATIDRNLRLFRVSLCLALYIMTELFSDRNRNIST